MEKEHKKVFLNLLDKDKTAKKCFIAFFILSILGFSLSVIIENREYPEAIEIQDISNEDQYVECRVVAITECIADYSKDNKVIDEYYLATDGSNVYILDLSKIQYTLLCNELQNEYSEGATIYGISTNIQTELKQIAIDMYNEAYNTDELTLENFEDYFTPYLINAKYNPNESATVLKRIGYIFGVLSILFGIYCIFIMIKSRKNIDEFSKEHDLEDLIKQLSSSSKTEYEKSKLIFLKDYIISYSSTLYIINYSDIIWAYPYDYRVYGIVTAKRIVIITKDKKQYIIGNTSTIRKKNKEQYEKCINEIAKRSPNALIGYSVENIVAMNKDNIDETINKIMRKNNS